MDNTFIWESEVRTYELDGQGIVNNACYLNYLDQARVKCFAEQGLNWYEWHLQGLDLVVYHIDITFRSSLRAFDSFYIVSTIKRSGRLRILFEQKIYRKNTDELVTEAIVTIVCVSSQTKRAVMPKELEDLF